MSKKKQVKSKQVKKPLSLRTKVLASVTILAYAAFGVHSVASNSFVKGSVHGCQLIAEKMINSSVSPTCKMRNSRLVLSVSTPIGEKLFDVESGLPILE